MAGDQTTAIVAIAVSGGVALLSAVVTPITAHLRQERALDDERERLATQLTAEQERLQTQLAAERERLETELSEGAERLDAQLSAERDRLDSRLVHERALHDLTALRALLAEADQALRTLDWTFFRVKMSLSRHALTTTRSSS